VSGAAKIAALSFALAGAAAIGSGITLAGMSQGLEACGFEPLKRKGKEEEEEPLTIEVD
jgi:hypothetical protein